MKLEFNMTQYSSINIHFLKAMRWVATLCLCLVSHAWAATCTSNNDGNWNGGTSVWSGCTLTSNAPPAGALVVISNNDRITVNVDTLAMGSVTINSGGTLRVSSGQTLTLTGNFTKNGSFSADNTYSGTVAFFGTAQSITGSTTFRNMSVGATTVLTLAGNVVVSNTLTGTPSLVSTCPSDYTLTYNSGTNVLHSCMPTCSAYKGQATINEVRIGSSKRTSTNNQVEIFNSGNVSPAVWKTWKLKVYYRSGTGNTPRAYGPYALSLNNGQFIYSTTSMYLRNRSGSGRAVDIALVDSNGAFIDYIAIGSTVQPVPPCMGTPSVVAASSSNDSTGDLPRLPDGGPWPTSVTKTSSHTIGQSNVCTAGGNDLVVSYSVDVSNPTINVTPVTYTVTVLNKSCTASIAGVKLTDTGILTTNFSSLAFTAGQANNSPVTNTTVTAPGTSNPVWTIGTLQPGASASLTMVGTPTVLGSLTSTATVSAAGTTLINTVDDSDSATINVRDYNYVGFDMSSDTVTEGVDLSYTVNISSDIPPAAGKPITVNYTVTGTAGSGDTDLGTSGSVVIDPTDANGDTNTSTEITFNITDDTIAEPGKTIIFTITSVSSADGASRIDTAANSMIITLLDNDTLCLTDTFSTGTLDTTLWSVAGNYTPLVVTSPAVTTNRLRLTDNASNRATFAQLKKWFPGAGNKIVVEFDYFGWGGSGADGIAMVLSDASVAPAPGGYGGSLGYANRSGIDGFGGGWLGIGLDEYGNYPGTGEGRHGYPSGYTSPPGADAAAGTYPNSIAVRGSGTAQTGYALLANTGVLATAITTGSSTPHRYRVTVDHSNNLNAWVTVERDLNSGSGFATLVPAFDVKGASSGQAAVPTNMLLSFTGSTGGSTNNHEIGNVKICATKMDPVGASASAANFECMDDFVSQASYNNRQTSPSSRNPIYTKLAKAAFKLRVVPLASDGTIKSDYIPAGGSTKDVTVEVFDDSVTPRPACNAYNASNLIATQTATLVSGVMTTSNFTINKAYPKLMCRVIDNAVAAGPVSGCSSDQFAVRPGAVTFATAPLMAAPPSASATPTIKAGTAFTLRAATSTSSTDGYSGTLTQTGSALSAQTTAQDTSLAIGGVVGTLSPASLVANASPSNNASYSEVGYLYLASGAYVDSEYTVIDQVGDCVAASTSDALASGKYGCVIGNKTAVSFGRFIPDHFDVSVNSNGTMQAACGSPGFTYTGQAMGYGTGTEPSLTIKPMNAATGGSVTQNYQGVFQKLANSGVLITSPTADATQLGRNGLTNTALTGTMTTGTLVNTSGTMTYTLNASDQFTYTRNANALIGSYTTAVPLIVDAVTEPVIDGVGATGTLPTLLPTGVSMRYGRAHMFNAYGSELLDLPVVFRTEYLSSTANNDWKINTADSCSNVTLSFAAVGAANITANTCVLESGNTSGKGCAAALTATQTNRGFLETGVAGFAGNFNLWLRASGATHTGSIDITATVDTWLQFPWPKPSDAANINPWSRATFGIYKSPLIYRRENY